ncbi:hypothetical protein ACFLXB_02325 [Chloroflexota bacterium]
MMEKKLEIITWLLDSDPAIRWQVMKDLQNKDEISYSVERQKLTDEGWCAELLKLQGQDGLWSKSLYDRKWISTTYTLYLLKLLGLPAENQQVLTACEQLITKGIYQQREIRFSSGQTHQDLGVTAITLSLCCYHGYSHELLHNIAEYLSAQQNKDGFWLPDNSEASMSYRFETTLLVLEGLLQYRNRYPPKKALLKAERAGQEYLLRHQLFMKDGKAIKRQWTSFSFPAYWFYDVLTVLEYFRLAGMKRDDRFIPGIELVLKKRKKDGTWHPGRTHPGKTNIKMDVPGEPSRWNTLRAMRMLNSWENADS